MATLVKKGGKTRGIGAGKNQQTRRSFQQGSFKQLRGLAGIKSAKAGGGGGD